MNTKLKLLKESLTHMEYYNWLAPFPVYDTGDLGELRDYIKIMERDKKDYDNLPTTACRHCMNLATVVDDLDNDICTRCGAINELVIFNTIFEYLEEKDKINENC